MTTRGAQIDLKGQILKRIADGEHGDVWIRNDFLDLGPGPAVGMALSRLASEGGIRNITRGFYDKPRINKLTTRLTAPNPYKIIQAVARKNGLDFIVDGITAANDLGFDTAVPAKIVVHTDARISPITLGNSTITFKETSGQKMFWAGRPAMRLVQALHWLRDRYDRDQEMIENRVAQLLADEEKGPALIEDLKNGVHVLPLWMQDLLRPHLDQDPAPGRTM